MRDAPAKTIGGAALFRSPGDAPDLEVILWQQACLIATTVAYARDPTFATPPASTPRIPIQDWERSNFSVDIQLSLSGVGFPLLDEAFVRR